MAIDTPATIAVLGAGPVGLEAALYARYLGYEVLLLERGSVAAEIEPWAHSPLLQPWGSCVSKLGLAALHAQHPAWRPPRAETCVTGQEWRESYLLPLAASDLLADSLRVNTEVLRITRCTAAVGASQDESPEAEETGDGTDDDSDSIAARETAEDTTGDEWLSPTFRLQVRATRAPSEPMELTAHVILDASGAGRRWTYLSGTDVPLAGELEAARFIDTGPRDVRGAERAKFAGRTTVVVGGGVTALANVAALVEVAATEPGTEIVWIVPPLGDSGGERLLHTAAWQRGSIRPELPNIAAALAARCAHLRYLPGSTVQSIAVDPGGEIQLQLQGGERSIERGRGIINNLSIRASGSRFFGLQPEICPVSAAPLGTMPPGAAPPDAQNVEPVCTRIAKELCTREAHFYVLGGKSFGSRADEFLLRGGWEQVRAVFTRIGGRPGLDLYATMDNLLPRPR